MSLTQTQRSEIAKKAVATRKSNQLARTRRLSEIAKKAWATRRAMAANAN